MSNIVFTDNMYNNNLFFYTVLKTMVKMKLTDGQSIRFQALIKEKREIFKEDIKSFKEMILKSELVGKDTEKYSELITLIEGVNAYNYEM